MKYIKATEKDLEQIVILSDFRRKEKNLRSKNYEYQAIYLLCWYFR